MKYPNPMPKLIPKGPKLGQIGPKLAQMGRKVALSTPNISRLVPYAQKRSTLSEPEFEKDNFFSPSHAH